MDNLRRPEADISLTVDLEGHRWGHNPVTCGSKGILHRRILGDMAHLPPVDRCMHSEEGPP
jgi:hypothetical protein